MPARILILDAIATNRIVLKVKMQAAQFEVDACANRDDALRAISKNRPDLVLVNVADPAADHHAFCKTLRDTPETASIALIATGISDTAMARFAALDAGADDVLPRPINETLLLARIRSLLRVRSIGQELVLRDSTSRALGFEDTRQSFEIPTKIAVITASPDTQSGNIAALSRDLRCPVVTIGIEAALGADTPATPPDLLIIDASANPDDERSMFGFVSDLRSRRGTRLASQLIIAPRDQPQVAALFLDLGADDVVAHDVSAAELSLRAKALIRRKQQHDRLRATVRSGLHAAITDPLTGLYNRRYLAPHLAKMADQAAATGREFAVMMLDIDHFKAINDTYGHAAGDGVLIQIANRLRENLRAIDLVARVGGEEFLVAMPRTSVRQAKLAADRLRRMVNNAPFTVGRSRPAINVTISVGVAVSNDDVKVDTAVAELCDCADQALYAAKSAGRNQVAMAKSAA